MNQREVNLHHLILNKNDSVRNALEKLESCKEKIVLVVNEQGQLCATVTDGDIRRGLLKGHNLDASIECLMNDKPVVAQEGESLDPYIEEMKKSLYRQLPIVDSNGRPQKLICFNELAQNESTENFAVIMAGGLGQRLRPFTEFIPKPMLEIDGQPMLHRLINKLKSHDITNIFVSINYRKEVIQDYFENGEKFGVKIQYIDEYERMGTAGALGLLPVTPTKPFIVLNADLVTKVNFRALLDFHKEHNSIATVCVRRHHIEVPFGVVNVSEQGSFTKITEKPTYEYLINAGIYAFDPAVLSLIKKGKPLEMPSLLQELMKTGYDVKAFIAFEQWIDVGCERDMESARSLAD